MAKLVLTNYTVRAPIHEKVKIAMLTDLHNEPASAVIDLLLGQQPDVIVMCGDILTVPYMQCKNSIRLFKSASEFAPVFYARGNHEDILQPQDIECIEALGNVKVLSNAWQRFGELAIGGLTPEYAMAASFYESYFTAPQKPEMGWMEAFCQEGGFKILLCHNPEYYPLYLKDRDLDLILSGHTHGGVIRRKGRGLFAPGQGFFPSYAYGMYDNKLIVSSGLSKKTGCLIPRICNPPEVAIIQLLPQKTDGFEL